MGHYESPTLMHMITFATGITPLLLLTLNQTPYCFLLLFLNAYYRILLHSASALVKAIYSIDTSKINKWRRFTWEDIVAFYTLQKIIAKRT